MDTAHVSEEGLRAIATRYEFRAKAAHERANGWLALGFVLGVAAFVLMFFLSASDAARMPVPWGAWLLAVASQVLVAVFGLTAARFCVGRHRRLVEVAVTCRERVDLLQHLPALREDFHGDEGRDRLLLHALGVAAPDGATR